MSTAGLAPDFRDMLAALSEAGAEFLVVGAHALAAHGIPRATGDFDIWVRPTADNSSRVFEALAVFGAPIDAHGIGPGDFAKLGVVYQIGLPPQRIDLLTSISGVSFDEAWRGKLGAVVDGLSFFVLGRDELKANKKAAGRDKDLVVRRLYLPLLVALAGCGAPSRTAAPAPTPTLSVAPADSVAPKVTDPEPSATPPVELTAACPAASEDAAAVPVTFRAIRNAPDEVRFELTSAALGLAELLVAEPEPAGCSAEVSGDCMLARCNGDLETVVVRVVARDGQLVIRSRRFAPGGAPGEPAIDPLAGPPHVQPLAEEQTHAVKLPAGKRVRFEADESLVYEP